MFAIVALSLVPGEWRPSTGLAKELEHGTAYFIVAVVLTIAGLAPWPRILAIVVLAAALEIGQIFVPGRDSNLTDFLASAAGALLGDWVGVRTAVLMGWLRRNMLGVTKMASNYRTPTTRRQILQAAPTPDTSATTGILG